MSKTKKLWIGFFTFLPILGIIGYFFFFFTFFFNIATIGEVGSNDIDDPTHLLGNFAFVFASLIIAVLSGFGILIYNIIHVVNNKKFTENNRLMWILILVLASGIGSIIYYFIEILPDKKDEVITE